MNPTQSHELIRTLTNIEKQLARIADALELKNIPDGEVIQEESDPYSSIIELDEVKTEGDI